MACDMDFLESYLKSTDEKYYVPDSNLENAKMVIFEAYPTAFDIRAKKSVSALKTQHGIDLFDEEFECDELGIGTAYISNVPLYGTDDETFKLAGNFEALRHSPRVESEYLRIRFYKKMKCIIESGKARVIAYKLEFFEKFYRDFLENAERELVQKLEERLADKSLTLLRFPPYKINQIKTFEKQYDDFKSSFDKIIGES